MFHRISILPIASIILRFSTVNSTLIFLREYLVYMDLILDDFHLVIKETVFAVISSTYQPTGNSLIISRSILLHWNQLFDEIGRSFQNGIKLHHL